MPHLDERVPETVVGDPTVPSFVDVVESSNDESGVDAALFRQ